MTLGPTENFLRAPEVETLAKNSSFCYNFDSTKQPLEGVPISENYHRLAYAAQKIFECFKSIAILQFNVQNLDTEWMSNAKSSVFTLCLEVTAQIANLHT